MRADAAIGTGPCAPSAGIGGAPSTPPIPQGPPTLASVNYAVVNTLGGSTVTLTGTNLTGASAVTYGGVACTSVTVVNSTTVTCVTPVAAAGLHDFVITTPATPVGTATLTNGAKAWYPTQIANVEAFYDSEVGVSVTGANVTTWADQTGARDLGNVGSEWPTWETNIFGTRHSVRYTDRRQILQLASHRVNAGGQTRFMICQYRSFFPSIALASQCGETMWSDSPAPVYDSWGFDCGRLDRVCYNGTNWNHYPRGSSLNDGQPRLLTMTHTTGGTIQQFVGATQQGANATHAYNTGTFGWQNFGIADGSDGYVGDIAVAGSCNGIISGADLSDLNVWSQSTYGCQAAPAAAVYNLIAQGDSITKGHSAVTPGVDTTQVAFPQIACNTMGSRYGVAVNLGIVGDRISDLITTWNATGKNNLRTDIPNVVVLLAGVNDVLVSNDGTPGGIAAQTSTIETALTSWVSAVRTTLNAIGGSQYIILGTMCSMDPATAARMLTVWTNVNANTTANYLAIGADGLMNVYGDVQMGAAVQVAANFAADKLHPNTTGQAFMGADLAATLTGMGLT